MLRFSQTSVIDRDVSRFRRWCCGVPVAAALIVASACAPPAENGASDVVSDSGRTQTASRIGNSRHLARPNIVLVVICSGRYFQMGFGGYERDTTPFLDSLAQRGVSFDNAVASSSWTKPTTASILTGMTPNVHRLTDYYEHDAISKNDFTPKRRLSEQVDTLPEILSAAGYATIGRNNNIHAGSAFNIMHGFDDVLETDSFSPTGRMLSEFDYWLRGLDEKQPFFFFMLTRDAHTPYDPRREFFEKFSRSDPPVSHNRLNGHQATLRAEIDRLETAGERIPVNVQRAWIDLYDAELAQLDATLSRLPEILHANRREAETIVVVTADHGERLFGPHGAVSHSLPFMEEEVLRIPLIFSGAGIRAEVKIPDIVRSIDIFPTLVELAGAVSPTVLQGRSLVPLLRGDAALPEVSAFASFHDRDFAYAVRRGRYKLHHDLVSGRTSLYDVGEDWLETRDLSGENPELVTELKAELEKWLEDEEVLATLVADGGSIQLTDEMLQQLRSLGYID